MARRRVRSSFRRRNGHGPTPLPVVALPDPRQLRLVQAMGRGLWASLGGR